VVRAPVVFISHGSPSVAIEDDGFTRALSDWGARLQRPRGFVIVSAHWEARGAVRVSSHPRPPVIHDFRGFPEPLYALDYPAPGDPGLAGEVLDLLSSAGLDAIADPARGRDHGAWVPLRLLRPAADVPVVEVSLPRPRTPHRMLELGRALAPLRDGGVVVLGSGGVVHNLELLRFEEKQAPVDAWAAAFDAWVADRLAAQDADALAGYRERAPHAGRAVPTSEHFDPLLVAASARRPGDGLETLFEGFHYGNLSMRSLVLESRV
jgi:4,5-DOPA dioxygenase extradiol